MITGKDLINWNIPEGKHFKMMLETANELEKSGIDLDSIKNKIIEMIPEKPKNILIETRPFGIFVNPETEDEKSNVFNSITHMVEIMRLPVVEKACLMPDTMPVSSVLGTIPVGGVVATKGTIHPGMHSADICCSMAISVFQNGMDISNVLDIGMQTTHFGYGKRSKSEVRQYKELMCLLEKFDDNYFLKNLVSKGEEHFITQGDGNHFFYVGVLESTGDLALVTHHGSRGLGAALYKLGMEEAIKYSKTIGADIPEHNAWLDFDTKIGQEYWNALQLIREWTKLNHYTIHDLMSDRMNNPVIDRFWNEHNFVFKRDDLFYHAKGSTPSFKGFSTDDDGRTLIPLNMSQPILITTHTNNEDTLGFAPHGAGRNISRSEHARRLNEEFGSDSRGLSDRDKKIIIDRETKGLDIRFYSGKADLSELPSSYKDARQVEDSIKKYNLAQVIDRVIPHGTIMAGELDQPWKNKKKANKNAE